MFHFRSEDRLGPASFVVELRLTLYVDYTRLCSEKCEVREFVDNVLAPQMKVVL